MVASNKNSQHKTPHNRRPNPTREEIRAACEKLQEQWDEREFEKRAGLRPKSWEVPRSDLQIDAQAQTN
jgi:protein-arginine kinase activator protein McsA